jgi:hypothetical protein
MIYSKQEIEDARALNVRRKPERERRFARRRRTRKRKDRMYVKYVCVEGGREGGDWIDLLEARENGNT